MEYSSRVLKDINSVIVDELNNQIIRQMIQPEPRKNETTKDAKAGILDGKTASGSKENIHTAVMSSGNMLVCLNDILVDSKSDRGLADNECGDNIYTNIEHSVIGGRVAILDRGDEILSQNNTPHPLNQPKITQEPQVEQLAKNKLIIKEDLSVPECQPALELRLPLEDNQNVNITQQIDINRNNIMMISKPTVGVETVNNIPSQIKPLISTDSSNTPIYSEIQPNLQILNNKTSSLVVSPQVSIPKQLIKVDDNLINTKTGILISLHEPQETIFEENINTTSVPTTISENEHLSAKNSQFHSLVSTSQTCDAENNDSGRNIQQASQPSIKLINEIVDQEHDALKNSSISKILKKQTPGVTELLITDSNSALSMEVPVQYLPQTKHELSVACQETNVDMLNKKETVKKNLLTMFDTFDKTAEPNIVKDSIQNINSHVNKLDVLTPTSDPQSVSETIIINNIQNDNQTDERNSLVNVNNDIEQSTSTPYLNTAITTTDERRGKQVEHSNCKTTNIVCKRDMSEFQKLNSEIKSNNEKIKTTLETVILNQILGQEYGSDVMPTLVEQSSSNNLLAQNENGLENIILNQILEQNNFRSMIDEIPDSKYVETQIGTDFQISDIDVTSADNFIEFVDEIIDFALRKVDFLKIIDSENQENHQSLTPVPEEPEETSETIKLNNYYDCCLFTPTEEPQNIIFPTLESFEIEELQAKVMEQVDALYLNETPINANIPQLLVPESPKVNELHAKAMEQAHELNLNETIAEFMYLHSADNVAKRSVEPVDNVNGDVQRKLPPPIAIAAVIENPSMQSTQSLVTNNQSSSLCERADTSQNEPFYLGDPPTMYRSQSNRSQSPMDTSQTKLSQSMNEVYFDKRLDITGKRSFRRERDQKITHKSKKDIFNENLNRDKSEEPSKLINTETPRDSLESLNEIHKTDSLAAGDNKQEQSELLDSNIKKVEKEDSKDIKDNMEGKVPNRTEFKDSLENLVEAVEQTESNNIKQEDEVVEKSMRDSLENLVEAVEAISENIEQDNRSNIHVNECNTNHSIVKNAQKDKKWNCNATKSNDITIVIDKVSKKGVPSDVKASTGENVYNNTTTAPNCVVQAIENVTPIVVNNELNNAQEHKNDKMSLDIMNGGDKVDSNKYYESVSNEPKIKTEFIMAEYRKPVGNSNGDLDKIINEYESKEESMIRRLTEKEKTITKMTGVMEAYEKTIAEMIAEKEQLIQEYEKKCVNLKSDADLNAQHLLSLEDTFADLHAKYERSKQMTLDLKTNEEELRKGNIQNLELLNAQEIRYEKMKSHAIGQLQIANEKLEHLQRAHAQETTKLKALLKREELARSSLTEQLQQKVRENEELVKICEELIGKE